MTKAEHDQIAELADQWRMEAKEVSRIKNVETREKVEALESCAGALSELVRNASVDPVRDAPDVDPPKPKKKDPSVGDISAEQAAHVADDDDADDDKPEQYAGHGPVKQAAKKR